MKYYLIYRTENLITGEFYYGAHETVLFDDGYLGSGRRLKEALKRYGVRNFKRRVVARCRTQAKMYELEKRFIAPWLGHAQCYNLHPGGKGGWKRVNSTLTPLQRAAISQRSGEKHRQRLLEDPEYRARWVAHFQPTGANALRGQKRAHHTPWLGKTHTLATREKMSQSAAGRWSGTANPAAGKRWIYHDELQQTGRVPRVELDRWIDQGWKIGRNVRYVHRKLS